MRALLFISAACVLATFAVPGHALAADDEVTICHIPQHNLESAHDITISESALVAHLAHGDFNGKCEDRPTIPGSCGAGEACFAIDDQCPIGDCNGPLPPLPASCDAVVLEGGGTCVDPPTQPPVDGTILVSRNHPGSSDDATCGSAAEPCFTITQGIARASATAATQVFVANGVYTENVVLVSAIDVLGGYSSDFSQRDVTGTGTVIHGAATPSPTVLADTITSPTVFEGFVVHGPSVTSPGENSVAMSIVDSTSDLEVKNNVIVAGLAAAGADGSHGATGADGDDGQPGGDFQNGAVTIPGGSGGFGAGGAGGDGGTSTAPAGGTQNGSGINGLTSVGGSGGTGGFNGSFTDTGSCVLNISGGPLEGSDGGHAGVAADGAAGTGALANDGSVVSGNWVSASGTDGTAGTDGSGGGGGGAGGGAKSIDCLADVTGPSGGGGGSGGGAGGSGIGGQGGGGAFAIFVVNGAPTITGNLIFLGTAGDGGQGGHGGGGGGGAGGPSVGIFSNFAATYDASNTIDTSTGIAGFGGDGGQSLGADGTNGEPGVIADVLF